ncbi:hypothetical protein BGZ70_002580, partial [Mortierella alpina]
MDRTAEFKAAVNSLLSRGQLHQTSHSNGAARRGKDAAAYQEFSRLATAIGHDINDTVTKLHKLTKCNLTILLLLLRPSRLATVVKRKALFDDRPVEISELTHVIKQDLSRLNGQTMALQQHVRANAAKANRSTRQMDEHSANLVIILQSKLANTSLGFKEALEIRSEQQYSNGSSDIDPYSNSSVHRRKGINGRSDDFHGQYEDDSESAGPASMLFNQQQHAPHVEQYVQNRSTAIEAVESTLQELGGIFQQLAQMVAEQRDTVQRIEANTDDIELNINEAQNQLLRYYRNISSDRQMMIKIFLTIIFVFLVISLGPVDPECPADLTPCFEDTFLKLIPVVFLVLAGVPRLVQLSKQESLGYPYRNWRQTVKLAAIGLLVALSLACALVQSHVLSGHRSQSDSGVQHDSKDIGLDFVASIVEACAFALALFLAVMSNKKSFLGSNVLLLFWLITIVITGIKLRTLFSSCPGGSSAFLSLLGAFKKHASTVMVEQVLVSAKMMALVIVLTLECIRKDTRVQLGEGIHERCPEEDANVFSIASFHWVTDLMRRGYAHPLTMDDLWELRKDDRSKTVSDSFKEAWDTEVKKGSPSLVKALASAFGRPFYIAGIGKVINDILGFMQPLLLRQMLLFVMSYKTQNPQPLYRGYTIAMSMFVCSLSQTTVVHQYFHLCFRTGMHARAGLVTAIYQKSLRLSNSARQDFTVGEIVNHMSIDAQRIQDLLNYLHVLWSGVFQITVTLYLLYSTMGWSIFAGLAVMFLMIPLNAKLSVVQQSFEEKRMKYKDSRIKLMNEVLNGIRVIKLYAWEGTFLQKILAVRNDQELEVMKKMGYISAAQMFTWASTPFMVSLVTFSVYTLVLGKALTTDVVFSAIALFNLLQFPLAMLPWVISSCIEARVSIDRVHKFLTSAETDPNAIILENRRDS